MNKTAVITLSLLGIGVAGFLTWYFYVRKTGPVNIVSIAPDTFEKANETTVSVNGKLFKTELMTSFNNQEVGSGYKLVGTFSDEASDKPPYRSKLLKVELFDKDGNLIDTKQAP